MGYEKVLNRSIKYSPVSLLTPKKGYNTEDFQTTFTITMKAPISCSATDSLEAAIVLKRNMRIEYLDKNADLVLLDEVQLKNLFSKEQVEWLELVTRDGQEIRIPTDAITYFESIENIPPLIYYNRNESTRSE